MYSPYILNQLMQEYYDFNQGKPDDDYPILEEPHESTPNGLSPDEEF